MTDSLGNVGPIFQSRVSQTYLARYESSAVPPVEVVTLKTDSLGWREDGSPNDRLREIARLLGGQVWIPPAAIDIAESVGEIPIYPSVVEAMIRDLVHYDLRPAPMEDADLANLRTRYRPLDADVGAVLAMSHRSGVEPAAVHDVVMRIMYQPTVPVEQSPLQGVPLAELVSGAGAGGAAVAVGVVTGLPWPIAVIVAGVSYILIRVLVGIGAGLEDGLHERVKQWVLNWGKTPPSGGNPQPGGTSTSGSPPGTAGSA